MKKINIDIETFSSVNLAKSGVYKYAESEDFDVLLFAYAVDDGEVHSINTAKGEKIPQEIIRALQDEMVLKWAFNAQFERVCLSRYLGIQLFPNSWRCTMVWSAYMGLPLSLEGVGAVLGLEEQKLKAGKELIRYFCMPCTPTKTNGQRTRNFYYHDDDKWQQFKNYNKRDVEVEMAIAKKLEKFQVPDFIWDEYLLDQVINDRGIQIDSQFVKNAIEIDTKNRKLLLEEQQALTCLDNPNSVIQLSKWLNEQGIEATSLDKKAVNELISHAIGKVKRVLQLRQQLAKSSVKKYQAMQQVACKDNRCRGMFQFLGASRTGRFAGRLVQLQNLPQNHIKDLKEARELVKQGNIEAIKMLYEDTSKVLSELIRTAFIPNGTFYVVDFSAIEARVIAWLAKEKWRENLFKQGGDIYCMSASQMFGVPVEKHGVNSELRQKGKIAELACIAENELVLTDYGLMPIQDVTTDMKVWDGLNWVEHDGVVYQGVKEVMEYDGLRATANHLIWTKGQLQPIYFGESAKSGEHLLQTGNGRQAIRLGENYQSRKKMESKEKSLLHFNPVHRLWQYTVAKSKCFNQWEKQRMSAVFTKKENSFMVRPKANCGETTLRKSQRQRVQKLWGKRYKIQVQNGNRSRTLFNRLLRFTGKRNGTRQDRQQWSLRSGQHTFRYTSTKQLKQEINRLNTIFSKVLALFIFRGNSKISNGDESKRNNSRCTRSCQQQKEKLSINRGKIRVYDIRNAGPYHRFTVSDKLVHNCGYGGSVGALTAMGALEMGLKQEELQPLVNAWRGSNQKIVQLWWAVDKCVKETVKEKKATRTHGITFSYQSGMLFITLPSGRKLTYIKPRIGENKFGGESVTYEGVGATKKWERIESYGPKFVENIVQGIARDILMYAMKNLKNYQIVAHVHDEVIIEATDASLDEICRIMKQVPPWANGLILDADGYTCEFYQKD